MKKRFILFTLLFSVYLFANDKVLSAFNAQEQRVALVIGNGSYQEPLSILHNTINDSRALRKILQQRGFTVLYQEDVNKRTFRYLLETFYKKLQRGGVGLLYFSGHGLEVNGGNYLIPTDAKIRVKSDIEFEAIALDRITKRMQSIKNRLNIVILDACRSDPFAKAVGVGGLAESRPIGLFLSYATGAGQTASDGRVGGNGLFTHYLIQNMQKPLSLYQVFKKTQKNVYEVSRHTQFPAIYDQTVDGEFYFTPAQQQSYYLPPLPTASLPTLLPLESILPKYQPNFRVFSLFDIEKKRPLQATVFIKGLGYWSPQQKIRAGQYTLVISAKNHHTKEYVIKVKNNGVFDFTLSYNMN